MFPFLGMGTFSVLDVRGIWGLLASNFKHIVVPKKPFQVASRAQASGGEDAWHVK